MNDVAQYEKSQSIISAIFRQFGIMANIRVGEIEISEYSVDDSLSTVRNKTLTTAIHTTETLTDDQYVLVDTEINKKWAGKNSPLKDTTIHISSENEASTWPGTQFKVS